MMAEARTSYDTWTLTYEDWDASEQPKREALCALGNGYFATRGAAEEAGAGGPHYPGTYISGGYNRLESEVSGRIIENEDLVNWPNWLCLSFRCESEEWFNLDSVELLEFRQALDLKRGVLERRMRFRHAGQRETTLVSRRLVHMGEPNLAAIQWELTPENWSGPVEIRSALDGSVINSGVARYRKLSSKHLEVLETGQVGEDGIYLAVQTNQSHIRMTQAARTQAFFDGERAVAERETLQDDSGIVEQRLVVECECEKPLRIEKIVSIYTSRDFAISEPTIAAKSAVNRAGNFSELLETHELAWKRLWNRADIEIRDGDGWHQLILRLHVFHLLQTTSFNSIDRDAGVPARGIHGEAYRGHIFWDELFIFPFLNLRFPELTRSLLMYRYRRISEARELAREAGFRGAMYPWQSGASGREETQVLHLNPKSGRWLPDLTQRQRHVNAAIAWNVWQYFQATRDLEFLAFYGAEMLLEIARFWASMATFNVQRERFEIHNVVGPDEFHVQYPDTESEGLNNNAYTNVLAAWTLERALESLDWLSEDRRNELLEQLQLSGEELKRWDDISRQMFVPFHGDGIISQFEGYEKLKEFDWEGARAEYGDIHRLDRVLEAQGDSANRYKASKQADVVMLFYLFSFEELAGLFQRLGYPFDHETIRRNIDYYMGRTSHGSTLSGVVHSWVLSRSDREQAWHWFSRALESDVSDIQGGTTSEGIHLGAMAGTVDIIQRCHTGIEIRDQTLWFNPCLPDALSEIRLQLQFHEHSLRVRLLRDKLEIALERGASLPAKIGVCGEVYEFSEGDRKVFDLPADGNC